MGSSPSRLARLPWRRAARAFMAAAVALSLLGVGAAPSTHGQTYAQPLLLEMSARQPDATVGVIVQKLAGSSGVEGTVAALGGKVTKDLSIINAFAATMPAGAVDDLARSAGVRWVSADAAVVEAGKPGGGSSGSTGGGATTGCADPNCIDTTKLHNQHIKTIRADQVWNTAPYLQGQGTTVAVVDSGIHENLDFKKGDGSSRIVAKAKFNSFTSDMADAYGHGTHVAGVIAGNSAGDPGKFMGVAPKANLVNVKVSDNDGKATASDVVAGLQWVLENKNAYNIRVVNLSLNSSVYESYKTSPLCAAVEILWFNGIVVVVSAGNNGSATLFPPANDPFAITVGAVNDMATPDMGDDLMADFSAYGTTPEGFAKPDLVAPGYKIKSVLAPSSELAVLHPDYLVTDATTTGRYFKMSGTSMAAPMVAGAVALLLQDEPNLTPDQVKYRLKATAVNSTKKWGGFNRAKSGAGYLDVYAAVNGTSTSSANTGVEASRLLWSGSEPLNWGSVNWNSVNWNSVNWNSVNWNSVNWNSVNWNSTYWGP